MHARSKGLILFCCIWLYWIESPRVFAIPPAPAINGVGFFVQDYAGLFEHAEHSLEEIKDLQKQAFELHSTPIIIVTIDTMKPYGYHPNDFEHMATQWFKKWEIGTEKINGKNQGILILLTKQERKCRIELGADWGRIFDDHCQKIMKYSMIPYFKSGDYASGLQKGTERLLALASSGPTGPINKLPKPNSNSAISFSVSRSRTSFEIGWKFRIILILIGTTGIILGIFFTPNSYLKKCGICAGLGLLIIGIFPPGPQRVYFSFILFAIGIIPNVLLKSLGSIDFSSSYSGGSYSGGSYSGGYSGGGFSGGSSGGGGASGSW